ncbi:hypothetical protein BH23GEM10_BH23GEM10_11900 [soil metagenome]
MRRWLTTLTAAPAALTLLLAAGDVLHAQQPQAAIVPASITVGDVFRAAVRVELPPGTQLIGPDTLAVPTDVEAAGRRELRVDSAGGALTATLTYPLAAWRPGTYELPPVMVRIAGDGADRDVAVQLPSFPVLSVLPADTAGIEPREAKDVLGANRVWWPILLALLVALAIAVARDIWWRRRRVIEEVVEVPVAPARDIALAQLRELRAAGLLEKGHVKQYYERLTATLRQYAAAIRPRWGVDLTTSELGARLRGDLPVTDALELVRILGAADLVKFARARPPADIARTDLDAAERWVGHVGRRPEPEPDAAPAGTLEAA